MAFLWACFYGFIFAEFVLSVCLVALFFKVAQRTQDGRISIGKDHTLRKCRL